jgi:hypothetical protein
MQLWRDPLSHFVAIGALVFAAHRALAPAPMDAPYARVIELEPAFVDALVRERAARTGRPAEALDRAAIATEWVREEALVREAEGLGLGAGDAIIRRRLVQKLELLVAAGVEPHEPTDAELEAYLAEHASELREPARVTFEQRFFSRDRRGAAALDDASASLALGDAGDRGDAFPLGSRFERSAVATLAETFGPGFVEALVGLGDVEPSAWSGPIESRFGVHLVRVEARSDERPLRLEEVRSELVRRVSDARERAEVQAALDAIVASYRLEGAP